VEEKSFTPKNIEKTNMKLFTKSIDNKLFAQYEKGSDLKSQMVIAKIFNPYGRGTWYILNSDPEDPDYLWAITDLFEVEVGSVSRNELENIRVKPFRLPLERDMYFNEINAYELYQGLKEGKRYGNGGSTEEGVDLLENYDEIPDEVKAILEEYEMEDADYDTLENLKSELEEIGYTIDYDLGGTPYDLRKIGERGKSEYANGGVVEYITSQDLDKKNYFFRRKKSSIGSFAWIYNKKYNEGYLYALDDFDFQYYSHIKLKKGEVLFRYNTDKMMFGEMLIIKLNLDKGLIYFVDMDLMEDEDKNLKFDSKGTKAQYIAVVYDELTPSQKNNISYAFAKGGYMAKGGNVKGDSLENVREDAKSLSKNTKQRIYLFKEVAYDFVAKSLYTKYTIGDIEDYNYIKGLNRNLGSMESISVIEVYNDGKLESSKQELIFQKNELMAKGGMLTYEGKKAKVISKKKDDKGNVMYFVEVDNYYPNGDTLRTILRDSDFDKMAKGGYMADGGEMSYGNYWSYHGRMLNDVFEDMMKRDLPNTEYSIAFRNKKGQRIYSDKKDLLKIKNYLSTQYGLKDIEKVEITEASQPIGSYTHYLYLENVRIDKYSGEVSWQSVNRGDSALVIAENKMGVVIQTYGRRFHLKFPDGTDKTYFAEELKFFKDEDEYSKGGKIKNQYDGRTPQDIWDNLSKEQRAHFIYDHKEEIEEYRGNNFGELTNQEIKEAYNSSYDELDENIKNRFDNHTREGQYAKGGVAEGEWVVYVGNDQKIIGTYKSNRAAKMALDKLWESGEYESAGIGAKSEAYSEKYFAMGGETGNKVFKRFRHKHIPTMTYEVIDYTSNGYKGIQKDSKSLSAKERKEGKITYYSKSEIKELFNEEYADGGYMEDGGYVVYDKYFNDQGKLRVRIIGKYKNRLAAKKNSRGEDGVGYSFTDMDTFNQMYDAKMIDDNKMANGGRLGDSTYLVQMAEQYAEKEYGKKVKKGQGVAKAQKVGDAYDYSQVTIFFEDGSQETFEREDFEEFFELED